MLSCMGCPVDATRWHFSQACNTSSPSGFLDVEMVSLLQLYATTGLNLSLESYEHKGMSHIFPQQHRITVVMALAIDNEKRCKPEC